MPIFDPVMAGQGLNFGDLFVKNEVFQISEPIFAKACDFDERVPRTIINKMACV